MTKKILFSIFIFLLLFFIIASAKTMEISFFAKNNQQDQNFGLPFADEAIVPDYNFLLYEINILDSEPNDENTGSFVAEILNDSNVVLATKNFELDFVLLSDPIKYLSLIIVSLEFPYFDNAKYFRIYSGSELKYETALATNSSSDPETCFNWKKDINETGIDCGGVCLRACGTCFESDNGKDINKAGITVKDSTSKKDKCYSTTKVTEYYCNKNSISTTTLSCAKGYSCKDGACIKIATLEKQEPQKNKLLENLLNRIRNIAKTAFVFLFDNKN